MSYLAMDIGSSLVKWARMEEQAGLTGKISTHETASFVLRSNGLCELNMEKLAAFLRVLIETEDSKEPLQGVYLSVQMHGMTLLSRDSKPLCGYITWEDTRGLRPIKDSVSALDYAKNTLGKELQCTGAWLNPGFSVVQLIAMRAMGYPVNQCRMAMLGDALTEILVGHPVPVHVTNACASGMYDLEKQCWSGEILSRLHLDSLQLPAVALQTNPVGMLNARGRRIPVFCAVGDLQAAVLGTDLQSGEIMINIATGSQLILPTPTLELGNHETRAYFDGNYLKTITRIPAGRSLTRLTAFFQDIGKRLFDKEVPTEELWRRLLEAASSLEDSHGMKVDLHFFDGAENGTAGAIEGIDGSNLDFAHIMYAAYEGMAQNYKRYYRQLECGDKVTGVCLAGGISKKTELMRRMISDAFQMPVRVAKTEESALNGLAQLMKGSG